jgi:hypothetical protein
VKIAGSSPTEAIGPYGPLTEKYHLSRGIIYNAAEIK